MSGAGELGLAWLSVAPTAPHTVAPGLTSVQSLTILLTVESLLLAVVSLAVSVGNPTRIVRAFVLPPIFIGWAATAAIGAVAFGAISAWLQIFTHPFPGGFSDGAIAVVLLIAICAEPVFAVLLSLGLRTRK